VPASAHDHTRCRPGRHQRGRAAADRAAAPPGAELRRLTPRNNDQLLFDGVPWVRRAQEEHDAFAAELGARGVEVLYLDRLLAEVLTDPAARAELITAAVDDPRLGATLKRTAAAHLAALSPEDLARALVAGVAHDELPGARGLSWALMARGDFVVPRCPTCCSPATRRCGWATRWR
jgi:arginine deiminase (EC 3.5.3.6)